MSIDKPNMVMLFPRFSGSRWLISLAILGLQFSICLGQQQTAVTRDLSLPFDQIAVVAGKQYSGKGMGIEKVGRDGAQIHCVFQRLNAVCTPDGLWLYSTADGAKGAPFRAVACALGRSRTQSLASSGRVEVGGQKVRYVRPGLIEEYSTSVEGLQQDFVIERRPEGQGRVRLELALDGASARTVANGAQLVLADGGRKILYHHLGVVDAQGRQLAATLEVLSPSRVVIALDDADADYPVRIDPTFSDANWIGFGGGALDVNGIVEATAVDGAGHLFVGGTFTVAGKVIANHIAVWDGTSWSALGAGMNGPVEALAVSGTNLYAGGDFTSAGGIAASNIARWNGTSWSALGSGVDSDVYALAPMGTNLYAGGRFYTAGGITVNFIAQWNGSSWSSLATGMGSEVHALAVSGSNLYAGGFFTMADVVPANYIARWDGSSWSALGSGMDAGVHALVVSGGNLYAGGDFLNAGGAPASHVAQWDGSTWSALGSGITGGVGVNNNLFVNALAVMGNNLYAGGWFSAAGAVSVNDVAQWDGTSWSALDVGVNFPVYSLAVVGSNLYAGNDISTAPLPNGGISKWNGSAWSTVAPGMTNGFSGGQGGVQAVAILGTNLYVGGSFTNVCGVAANCIARWDGSSWTALGSGLTVPGGVGGVSSLAQSGNTLYAGGSFTVAGGVAATNVAQWDGNSWSALGSGLNGNVNALVFSGGILYAGGIFLQTGKTIVNHIAQWNGSAWLTFGNGTTNGVNNTVYALAIFGGSLYAGGAFTTAGGKTANGIAQWNGSTWLTLGPGTTNGLVGTVYALAASATDLYAGGSFSSTGSHLTRAHIAEWDGASWLPLGSPSPNTTISGIVYALAVSGTNLYVGGQMTLAGSVAVTNIAKWDGTSWSGLGSGVNGNVKVILPWEDSLYVGGYFTIAGGQVSPSFARALLNFPVLSISNSANGVLVSWPSASPGWMLLQNSDLGTPGNWTPPGESINDDGTNKFITVHAPGGKRFYRLRTQ